MVVDRDIEEVVARCVSIAVLHHNNRKTRSVEEQFTADVASVVLQLNNLGMGDREAEQRLVQRLDSELIARYGQVVGKSLSSNFFAVYRSAGNKSHAAQAEVNPMSSPTPNRN